MGTDNENQLLKILSTLKEFREPIQLAALMIGVFYFISIGPYTYVEKVSLSLILGVYFLLSIIPEWRKVEVKSELDRRRIDADLERSKYWNDATFRGMSERTRIESVQRKQGALDAYSAIERFLEKKLEEKLMSEDEKAIHQQVLEEIGIMKKGANSFAVGTHERFGREMKEKRGRLSLIEEKKNKESQ